MPPPPPAYYPGQSRPYVPSVQDDPNASILDKSADILSRAVQWPVKVGFKVVNAAGNVVDNVVGGLINAGQEVTTSAVDLALTGGYGTGNLA